MSLRGDNAVLIFPKAEKEEGNGGPDDEEFGATRDFDFRLPAKELRRKKECKNGPENEGANLDTKLPDGHGRKDGALQTLDEVGCRKK